MLLEHGARFGHHVGRGDGWWLLGTLLQLLVLAALVALAVMVAQRIGSGARRGAAAGPTDMSAARPDEALAQLRLRYARGEVSREDYLRTAADLGSPVASADQGPPPGR